MPKTHIFVSGINHPQNVRFIVGLPTWLFFLHMFYIAIMELCAFSGLVCGNI